MLEVFTVEQSEQWDKIVRSFSEYDIYWLSGYVKAFTLHGDGKPLLLYCHTDEARGINVVMKRDIATDPHFKGTLAENRFFDLSSPYGYGGWLTEGESNALFEEYGVWCRETGIISEFVRFHPLIQNKRYSRGYYEIVDLGNTVVLDLSSREGIWENIISKNRNMIRKAEKAGIQIYQGRNPALYRKFKELYDLTMAHNHAEQYYFFDTPFYQSVCEDLPENAQVFYAQLDGEIIAASIILTANGRMNYHLSASSLAHRHLAPSNLLLYKAALWGYENGYKTFYLGGGLGSAEDNLFKFKKSFYRKDDVYRFSIGKKIFDEQQYQALVQQRETIENESFFPRYRG